MKYYELRSFESDYLQAKNEAIEDWHSPVTLSAVYCPSKYILSNDSFDHFFESLGGRFIAGGNFNAKHPQSESTRNLLKSMKSNKLNYLSPNEPTY